MSPRVAVVGSREYPDLVMVAKCVRALFPGTVVITGGAQGVDKTAEKAARIYGLAVEVYHADWKKHGRAAGPVRNKQIVDACDRMLAFWDGESPGTRNAINLAKKAGKPVAIFTAMRERTRGGGGR